MRGKTVVPGLRDMTDDDLTAWMNAHIGTQYHPCATCKMGKDDNSVVDASVFPTITSGNLHCPTPMVAENLSGMPMGRTPLVPEQVAYQDQALRKVQG